MNEKGEILLKTFRGKLLTIVLLFLSFFLVACCGDDKPEERKGYTVEDKTVTETKLVVYEGPNLLTTSSKVSVKVEDEELFVYETRVNHNRIFSFSEPKTTAPVVLFDFEGEVDLEVTVNDATEITNVQIRPLFYDIKPEVNGNKISFTLRYSGNYVLEYEDGNNPAYVNAVHIFANPLETDPIDPENIPDDVIYLGPGVYSAGAIPVTSGKTVYLAGGAYVYGQIRAEQMENITIRGRGIISGEIYQRTKASEYTIPIEMRNCSNINIEGITILDPAGWTVALYKCNNVNINNLKIITARGNGDGISVQSCSDVLVKGGFVRTWDDSLVVKNVDRGNTANITFDNVVVWTDLAQSCEVGFETNGEKMENITFKNITIVHNFHKAAMSIHNSDDADISNVNYTNITIEDGRMLGDNQLDGESDYLVDITIAYNANWTKSGGERGTVTNVNFSNIKVHSLEDSIVSRINGESTTSLVQDVNFTDIEIEGEAVRNETDLKLGKNTYVKNVKVESKGEVTGAIVHLPYELQLKNDEVKKTVVPTKQQEGLEVPDFAMLDIDETYKGKALSTDNVSVYATHGKGSQARADYDDGSGSYETEAGKLVNLFDGNRKTAWISRPWTGEEEEFVAITVDFHDIVTPGLIRIYLDPDSAFVYQYEIGVFIKRTPDAENFSRTLSTAPYTITPATGNYFDIRLSSTLSCSSLQLRIFRKTGMTAPKVLSFSEIAFFPSSLSTNKPIIDSTEYNDVYEPSYLVDGNENTYWEAKTSKDAYFIVDLGKVYDIHFIVLHLPPLLTWEMRTQEIEIQYKGEDGNYQTAVPKTGYVFDPLTGNFNNIEFKTPLEARYLKLIWSSNSSIGGYGAQLSEIFVYGE